MAEVKHPRHKTENEVVVDRAKDFWGRFGKVIMIASAAVIVVGGGYLAYKYFVKAPKEQKAAEAVWKAESYFGMDSMAKALSGDAQYAGAEKVASQYGGTQAGNLANFIAGVAALKAGDNAKAVKFLKEFKTDARQVQARAYKLLADAQANLNQNNDALANYKKAAHEFEADQQSSAEYLFFAAYFADRVVKDKNQSIELFKELKQKYNNTQFSFEADKYLAQAGVYKDDK
jgi:hypothetical protein